MKVLLANLPNSVLLPTEAVKLGQNGRYVFVIKDDSTVDLRFVDIGQSQGDFLVIRDGVSAGEKVVLSGQLMLAPGARVVEVPDQGHNIFEENLKKNKSIAEKNPTVK